MEEEGGGQKTTWFVVGGAQAGSQKLVPVLGFLKLPALCSHLISD